MFARLITISFLLIGIALNCSAQDIKDYRLGAGDTIKISVWGEPDLSLETQLTDSGSFNYPFLGSVKATGLTIEKLKASLVKKLSPDYLLNPDVNVQIVSYRGFFIRGEVKSPGAYAFQPGLTIAKAVSLAGGFSKHASLNKITIVSDNEGQQNKRKANLDTLIQPGDTIDIAEGFF